jgi:hypothetical protein
MANKTTVINFKVEFTRINVDGSAVQEILENLKILEMAIKTTLTGQTAYYPKLAYLNIIFDKVEVTSNLKEVKSW